MTLLLRMQNLRNISQSFKCYHLLQWNAFVCDLSLGRWILWISQRSLLATSPFFTLQTISDCACANESQALSQNSTRWHIFLSLQISKVQGRSKDQHVRHQDQALKKWYRDLNWHSLCWLQYVKLILKK